MDDMRCFAWLAIFLELFCCGLAAAGGWMLGDPDKGPWAVVIGAATFTVILMMEKLLTDFQLRESKNTAKQRDNLITCIRQQHEADRAHVLEENHVLHHQMFELLSTNTELSISLEGVEKQLSWSRTHRGTIEARSTAQQHEINSLTAQVAALQARLDPLDQHLASSGCSTFDDFLIKIERERSSMHNQLERKGAANSLLFRLWRSSRAQLAASNARHASTVVLQLETSAQLAQVQDALQQEHAANKSMQIELQQGRAAKESAQGELLQERAGKLTVQGELVQERAAKQSAQTEQERTDKQGAQQVMLQQEVTVTQASIKQQQLGTAAIVSLTKELRNLQRMMKITSCASKSRISHLEGEVSLHYKKAQIRQGLRSCEAEAASCTALMATMRAAHTPEAESCSTTQQQHAPQQQQQPAAALEVSPQQDAALTVEKASFLLAACFAKKPQQQQDTAAAADCDTPPQQQQQLGAGAPQTSTLQQDAALTTQKASFLLGACFAKKPQQQQQQQADDACDTSTIGPSDQQKDHQQQQQAIESWVGWQQVVSAGALPQLQVAYLAVQQQHWQLGSAGYASMEARQRLLQGSVDSLSGGMFGLKQQVKQTQSKLQSAEASLKRRSARHDELLQRFSKQRQQRKQLQEQLVSSEASLKQLSTQHKALLQQHRQLHSSTAAQDAAEKQMLQQLAAAQAQVSSMQQLPNYSMQLLTQHTELSSKYACSKGSFSCVLRQLKASTSAKEQQQQQLAAAQAQVSSMQQLPKFLGQLMTQHRQLSSKYTVLKGSFSCLLRQLKASTSAKEQLMQLQDQQQQELAAAQTETAAAQSQVSGLQGEMEELQAQHGELLACLGEEVEGRRMEEEARQMEAEQMQGLQQRLAAQAAALNEELGNSSYLASQVELLQAFVAELQLAAGAEQDCVDEGEEVEGLLTGSALLVC